MLIDIPNAFIQALFLQEPDADQTTMKVTGKLVDILVNSYPDVHKDYMALEKGKRVLHTETLKATHRMPEAELLWHWTFRKTLEEHWFIFNDYDLCVANKMVEGKQQTAQFRVHNIDTYSTA